MLSKGPKGLPRGLRLRLSAVFGYCPASEACLPLMKVVEASTIGCSDSILMVRIWPLAAATAFCRSTTRMVCRHRS